MTNTPNQDVLGTILSSPLGTENIAPCRPQPMSEEAVGLAPISTTAATEDRASQYEQSVGAKLEGGRGLLLAMGSATLA